MNIFNSLGSNYNLQYVISSLFSGNDKNSNVKLKEFLEKKYDGKVTLLYKGREAIRLSLRAMNLPEGSIVAINGFTCFAVYKAIVDEGLKVKYLDVDDRELNFSANTLKNALKNFKIKAVIIQNTLGNPCDIDAIQKICKERNIVLIEDLAHSIGTKYKDGREAGTIGDFVVLSFSQDKMVDGVSGGALVIRDKKVQRYTGVKVQDLTKKKQIVDRLYPLFTFLIRNLYGLKIGKILHAFLKKVHLLSLPMDGGEVLHGLPDKHAQLALDGLKNLDMNLEHRKKIASVYIRMLDPKILFYSTKEQISNSNNLRFPVIVEKRENLIRNLKSFGIYISDIWYDAPVAPKKYLKLTDYINQCPNAESISEKIVNLPTHINITDGDARKIADKINIWLKPQ